MKFAVKKLRPAEEDALEAALWYDEREPGLGDDFLDEVDAAVRRLEQDALIHSLRFSDVRRAPVRPLQVLRHLLLDPRTRGLGDCHRTRASPSSAPATTTPQNR